MIEQVLRGDAKPDASRRGCSDCRHCKAAVSWWCTNAEAKAARGSSFPGVVGCPFWAPCRTEGELSFFERRSSRVLLVVP